MTGFVVLERQYLIFIAAAGAGFAALIIVGLFFNPLQAAEGPKSDSGVIEARTGRTAYVHYSSGVIGLVQKLPDKNSVRIEAPSEILNTNLAGLRGELRYTDMTIKYVENGRVKEINEKDFKTVQYRFLPDAGNVTTYTYKNVQFNLQATNAELIASFVPLATAQVGQEYPVKMVLEGGTVDFGIDPKIVKVVQ
ncbi:MAG TPA: hypothetical protein VJP79_07430 [Nitrososphaera sp.]|nr:hypothetical protein [Nitrososphaera sp.]